MNLAPYAGESFELPYSMGGTDFCNVMARLPGRRGASSGLPILLAAHYDTCGPYPGADDNAAAIAAALLAAESLAADPIDADVVLAFFDAEEPPYFLSPSMGSTFFYEHQRQDDFRCAVVMDLVGHDVGLPGLENTLFLMGAENLVESSPQGPGRPLGNADRNRCRPQPCQTASGRPDTRGFRAESRTSPRSLAGIAVCAFFDIYRDNSRPRR
jgi:hypothetical protein